MVSQMSSILSEIIEQSRADDTDLAVMERRHGIAKMSEVLESGSLGFEDLCGRGRCVCSGTGDADLRRLARSLRSRTFHVWCQ
jgi:hypothetical protein